MAKKNPNFNNLNFLKLTFCIILLGIVLKIRTVIDSVKMLDHRVNSRISGSLIEPCERIRLNQFTPLSATLKKSRIKLDGLFSIFILF